VSRVCLDTSAYSNFCRGCEQVVEILDRARNVYVPAVVLGELRAGFTLGRRRDANEVQLQRFLAEPVVEILDIDDEASSVYADLWVALRSAGTPVPTNDVWIAAVAVRHGATVLTYDHHFELIARVGAHILGS